jgi:hypothetical protein
VDWISTNHVLRYLIGKMEYALRYLGGHGIELKQYTKSY